MAEICIEITESAPAKNIHVQAIDGKVVIKSTRKPNGDVVLVFHEGKQTYEVTAPAWWVKAVTERFGTRSVKDGKTFATFDFDGKAVRGQWVNKQWSGAVKAGKVYVVVK